MNNSVVIKGNKYGIVVVMDDTVPFDELKENLLDKFKSAAKFFDKANMAVSFEGRKLSPKEERECLDIISENSDLNIVCVIDNDELREKYFKKAVEDKLTKIPAYVVNEGMKEITLTLGELTDDEREIILKGCLINYNRQ